MKNPTIDFRELCFNMAVASDLLFHALHKKLSALLITLNEGTAEKIDVQTKALVDLILDVLTQYSNSKANEQKFAKQINNDAIREAVLASLERQQKKITHLSRILEGVKRQAGSAEAIVEINKLREEIHADVEMVKRVLRHVHS